MPPNTPPANYRPRTRAAITGWGHHLPEGAITNRDLEGMIETSDEWIVQRTGISQRRRTPDGEVTSDLALHAAKPALEVAGLSASDLDLIIVATCTPDTLVPSTACVLQHKLGAGPIPSWDLSAACSGFTYALSAAAGAIATGLHHKVLVVGAEVMTRFINYADRGTSILFGDGAGAVIVQEEGAFELHYDVRGADGSDSQQIVIPGGGSVEPASADSLERHRHTVHMAGREVFKSAVRQMSACARDALAALDLTPEDIALVVPHQANARILSAVAEAVGFREGTVAVDIGDTGNTTAASIPVAFSRAMARSRPEPGEWVMIISYGAGTTWGCQVLRAT